MGRLVLTALVVSFAFPAAAQAQFSAPQEVAAANAFHRGFVAAADASGRLTVATRTALKAPGLMNVPRLVERPRGGVWGALPPVRGIPSRPYVYATSLSAAGDGALGVAWVIGGRIQVAVREPRGTLSDPIEIAGAAAKGANHAAIAVNADGDVLLAYQTGTSASHTHDQGQIAIAYRRTGRSSFIAPVVVDHVLSNPPVVALARDGTGIVTWTRRQTLMAVVVGRDGVVGEARPLARSVLAGPVVAAGQRSSAIVAYRVNDTDVRAKRIQPRGSVRALTRPAGGSFGPVQRVFRDPRLGRTLALAADEQGRATLAWTQYNEGQSPDRVWVAAGRVGRAFGRPHVVGNGASGGTVSVAARDGHVALAWSEPTTGKRSGVAAAVGRWNEALTPHLIPSETPPNGPVTVAIAGDGRASAFWRAGKIWASDGS